MNKQKHKHRLAPQQLQGTAFLAAPRHALHAEAAGCRVARQKSENLIGDADGTSVVGDVDHRRCSFLKNRLACRVPADNKSVYYNTVQNKSQAEKGLQSAQKTNADKL